MTVPPSGFQPRSWIYVWLLLLAVVWAFGVRDSLEETQWMRESPAVCEGLEAYVRVAAAIPEDAAVAFLTDVPEPTSSQRYFCAQYELAPRVFKRWWLPTVEGRTLTDTVVMAHFDDLVAREAYYRAMVAEVQRQGIGTLKASEPVAGVLLMQVEER